MDQETRQFDEWAPAPRRPRHGADHWRRGHAPIRRYEMAALPAASATAHSNPHIDDGGYPDDEDDPVTVMREDRDATHL